MRSIIKYINFVRGVGEKQNKVKQDKKPCIPVLQNQKSETMLFLLQSSCLGLYDFINLLLSYIEGCHRTTAWSVLGANSLADGNTAS
jgi:hypothetical protein